MSLGCQWLGSRPRLRRVIGSGGRAGATLLGLQGTHSQGAASRTICCLNARSRKDAMTNAHITSPERPDIDHGMSDMATKCNMPEVAVIETTAREQELKSASPRPSGVLKELALAQWRGSATQMRPPAEGR